MKICLMPHPNTMQRFTYLTSNFREKADVEICFPQEDLAGKNADIFLLEDESPSVIQTLLSSEHPPLIVVLKEGVFTKHIRYLPDFPKGFLKLLREIPERNPILRLKEHYETYCYNQHDILFLQGGRNLTVYFRFGTKLTRKQSAKKIFKQLSPTIFFPVGEEIFVNIEYVSRLTDYAVYLQNGQKICFDSTMAEQVKNAFFKTKYLRNQPVL